MEGVEEELGEGPPPEDVCAYVEEMLLELAEMASGVGETALAGALGLVAIQAGVAAHSHVRKASRPADQAAR